MSEFPAELRYTKEHEWVRTDSAVKARIGITAYAAEQLGDIVYASLPTVGATVAAGDSCGELESTKSVSDVFSPLSGVIVSVNEKVAETPELINQSNYEEGWLFEVELSDAMELDALLDSASYKQLIEELSA